jgi:hypothetical protein
MAAANRKRPGTITMRVLTSEEMKQIERWARRTKIANMLSFFDGLPRFIRFLEPVLLGSNNGWEILVHGDITTSLVKRQLANLDEPFNPNLRLQHTIVGNKRESAGNSIRLVHQQVQNGFAELCLLKGVGSCGQRIVRAHSVQKAAFKDYASNGHVYHFEPIAGTRDEDKRLWPDLIGINNATTFTGFCDVHDSATFAPIETVPYQNSAEQKFLFHFRAFAQDYYGRAHRFKAIEMALEELARQSPTENTERLNETVKLNRHDLREMEPYKLRYEQCLVNKNWSSIDGLACRGEIRPDVFATQFFAPRKDFQGNIIQDTKTSAPLNWASLTVTASNNNAIVLLCGEKGSTTLRVMADSLLKVPQPNRTTVVLTYIFCYFENFILLPSWWESLTRETQAKFVNAAEGRYYRRELPITSNWNLTELR